jgi:hypothetical protein
MALTIWKIQECRHLKVKKKLLNQCLPFDTYDPEVSETPELELLAEMRRACKLYTLCGYMEAMVMRKLQLTMRLIVHHCILRAQQQAHATTAGDAVTGLENNTNSSKS